MVTSSFLFLFAGKEREKKQKRKKSEKENDIIMKEYKVVFLNKGLKWSREKDLEQAQDVINQYASEGWELQQVLSPSDLGGAMVGVFYKEKA